MLSNIVTFLHIIVTVGLIAAILLQSGKSAGLGTIGGGAEKILGKKKKGLDHILSKATVIAAGVFLVSAVLLSIARG